MSKHRADFTNSLIHLTRERNIKRRHFEVVNGIDEATKVSAFEVLKEILTDGIIRGSGKEGFIKGAERAVCFSEVPLSGVKYFANTKGDEARYRFYGIAISKRAAFDCGGRPVIYLPDDEGNWIPPDQKWRHVRFEYGTVDHTHEREWRVKGDLDLKNVPGFYVILWNPSEVNQAEKAIRSDLKKLVRGYLPMEHLIQMF